MLRLTAHEHLVAIDGADDAQTISDDVLMLVAVECIVVLDGTNNTQTLADEMSSLAADERAAALNGINDTQTVADEMLTLVTCAFNDTGDDDNTGNDCCTQAVADGDATTEA